MTKVIGRFGDMMLGALLGRDEAGACVPENGQYCGCRPSNGYCGSDGHWYVYYRRAYYNCNGACVTTTSRPLCYTQRTGAIC